MNQGIPFYHNILHLEALHILMIIIPCMHLPPNPNNDKIKTITNFRVRYSSFYFTHKQEFSSFLLSSFPSPSPSRSPLPLPRFI